MMRMALLLHHELQTLFMKHLYIIELIEPIEVVCVLLEV